MEKTNVSKDLLMVFFWIFEAFFLSSHSEQLKERAHYSISRSVMQLVMMS